MRNRKWSLFTALWLVTALCWNMVAAAAGPGSGPAPAIREPASFADLGEHWAKQSILWLAERGVVNGSADSTGKLLVRPDLPITRAEMTKVVIGLLGMEPLADPAPAFKDTAGHWSNGYVAAAKDAGITQGYPDGSFHPDGVINRAEMAALEARAFRAQSAVSAPDFADVTRGVAFTELARVDEQQALTNTARGVAWTKGGLSARRHLAQGVAFLEALGSRVPSSHVNALQSDLSAAWPDREKLLEHEAATVRDLSERWRNDTLRSPTAVRAFAHLLMSARQGAEVAVADAELEFGRNANQSAPPPGVTRSDWDVAAQLAIVARDQLNKANTALVAGDGADALDALRLATGAAARAPELGAVLESAVKLRNAGIRSFMDERLSQTLATVRQIEGDQLRTRIGQAAKLAAALQRVERGAPEFGQVLAAAKNANLRQYLEAAVSEGMALADDGRKAQLMLLQLREVAAAVRTPPVADEVYNTVRKVWEGGFTPEEAEMLRMMQPDHVTDPELKAVIKAMRDAIPPPAEGEMLRKVLTPTSLMIQWTGKFPDGSEASKSKIFSFITRARYTADARSVREMIESLRMDYEGGLPPLATTELYYVDFRYAPRDGVPGLVVPRSRALGGPSDCTDIAKFMWPFTCTGWLSSSNGRWIPEWQFKGGGHELPIDTKIYKAWMEVVDGQQVMKQKPEFFWNGVNWVPVPC